MSVQPQASMNRMRAYIDSRLALGAGANPDAVAAWVVVGTEAVRQPEVRKAYQEVVASEIDLVRELLLACLKANGKVASSASRLAVTLLTFTEGAFQLASAAGEIMPPGYAAPAALAIVESALAAAPPAKAHAARSGGKS